MFKVTEYAALTICVPMGFSILVYTIHLGLSIVAFEWSQVTLSKLMFFCFDEDCLSFENSVGPDETWQNAASHLIFTVA